jgi:hypothetical protein
MTEEQKLYFPSPWGPWPGHEDGENQEEISPDEGTPVISPDTLIARTTMSAHFRETLIGIANVANREFLIAKNFKGERFS